MSPTRRAAVLVAGVVLVVLAVGLLAWWGLDDGSSTVEADVSSVTAAVVSDVTAADAPFASLTAGTVRVGDDEVEVVVADSVAERIQGLRGRADAAPYAGMLFVFDDESTVGFTMAGVPDALDVAFFDARGRRIDQLRMEPCAGTDATCPLYEASAPFRYVLETAPGEMPGGRLQVRSAG